MTLFDAIILGIIQGITEFLPISSSGHLVLGQALLGVNSPGNVVEVVTHLGTLLSVIWVFWKDLSSILISFQNKDTQKYILFLIMGTLPAVIIGLAARDMITDLFDSIPIVAGSLIFTGIILLLTQKLNRNNKQLNLKKGLLIGLTQAFAMMPGISRSGMTISTGLALGLSGKDAAKFSFLLAIPVIAGAGLLTALEYSAGKHFDSDASIIIGILQCIYRWYYFLKMVVRIIRKWKVSPIWILLFNGWTHHLLSNIKWHDLKSTQSPSMMQSNLWKREKLIQYTI